MEYIPNSVFKFFKWTLPSYFPTQNDGIEVASPLSSPLNRKVYTAWHQPPDTVHDHTIAYRLLKSICDNNIHEAQLALDEDPQLLHQSFWDGFTPLSLASSLNRTAFIDYFTLRGADINQLDSQGRSPLIQAVINWQIESIKLLTERGVNIKLKGRYGYDALELAQLRNYDQITKFLQFQQSQNIKPNVPKFTIQFDFEKTIENFRKQLIKPTYPIYEGKQYPFNDYKGSYKINYIV